MLKKISLAFLLLFGLNSFVSAGAYFATNGEATAQATKLGYSKTSEISKSGQLIFKRSTKTNENAKIEYISGDVDSHNGGAWKGAS